MVCFHAANAPGGVYLGHFLSRNLHATERHLTNAFAMRMISWMIVVWPVGWLSNRWVRRPLLIAACGSKSVDLIAETSELAVAP
jgi:hypothetical protein